MQRLASNTQRLSLSQLLQTCNQEQASDSMVLFLRAVTAAAVQQRDDPVYHFLLLDPLNHAGLQQE